MTAIKPISCITPKIIAEEPENKIFKIPIYQRLFAWDDDDVSNLLMDFYRAYEETAPEYSREHPYYIGLITSTPKSELVDGQQRLTVLMFIGIILREYYKPWEQFLSVVDSPRMKFIAREKDDVFFHKLITDKSFVRSLLDGHPFEDSHEHQLMLRALNTINCTISNHEYFHDRDYIEGYARYIFENASFFVDCLPYTDSKELNTYFEAMNSTGKNLESHELIKVELLNKMTNESEKRKRFFTLIWNAVSDMDRQLIRKRQYNSEREKSIDLVERFNSAMELTNDPENLDVESLFKEGSYINDFDSDSTVDSASEKTIAEIDSSDTKPGEYRKENRAYRSMLRFSDFILIVLYLLNSQTHDLSEAEINKKNFFDSANLKETFKKYGEWILPEYFILSLLKYRLLFDYFVIQISSNDDKYRVSMKEIDSDTNESKHRLIQFESFLYVYSNKKTNYRWLCPLLNFVSTKPSLISFDDLLFRLKSVDNELHPISKLDNPLLFRYDNGVDRYWFWRIDYYLWQERSTQFSCDVPEYMSFSAEQWKHVNNCVDSYTFRRNRSIEHVAAQHPKDENGNAVDSTLKNLNEFGNLVLISSGMNSSLRNSTYKEKRGHIESCIDGNLLIESLAMLQLYNSDPEWTDERIASRTERMLSFLKESYTM